LADHNARWGGLPPFETRLGPQRHNLSALAKLFRQQEFLDQLVRFFRSLDLSLKLHDHNAAEGHEREARFYREHYFLALRGEDVSKRNLD
jgi:hypothetical protein